LTELSAIYHIRVMWTWLAQNHETLVLWCWWMMLASALSLPSSPATRKHRLFFCRFCVVTYQMKRWDAGVVICLERSANTADDATASPLFHASPNGLCSWNWLARVVLEKKSLNEWLIVHQTCQSYCSCLSVSIMNWFCQNIVHLFV